MEVKLVFWDWHTTKFPFESVYNIEAGIRLSSGDFHAGTTFNGEIVLDAEQERELKEAMERGYVPVFKLGGERK